MFAPQRQSLKAFLLMSLLVAAAAFITPLLFGGSLQVLSISVGLSALWALLVVVGIVRLRRRGLWLLFGLPLAATWVVWLGSCLPGSCV